MKKAPSMDINAKIRIHPNIDWFLPGQLMSRTEGVPRKRNYCLATLLVRNLRADQIIRSKQSDQASAPFANTIAAHLEAAFPQPSTQRVISNVPLARNVNSNRPSCKAGQESVRQPLGTMAAAILPVSSDKEERSPDQRPSV
jgi:hypothetical protein